MIESGAPASAPANWYPDPDGGGGYRWWNGHAWGDRAPAQTGHPSARFEPGAGLGIASAVLVVTSAVVQVAAALTAFPAMDRQRESVALTGTTDAYLTAYDAVVLIQLPLFLASYVVTCLWLWRARKNAELLRPERPHARRRGWVWGGWVCPIVAFWFPFQVVRDVDRATAETQATSLRVGWWWTGMLVYLMAWNISGRIAGDVNGFEALGAVETIGAMGAILAAPLWVLTVRAIGRTQAQVAAGRFARA